MMVDFIILYWKDILDIYLFGYLVFITVMSIINGDITEGSILFIRSLSWPLHLYELFIVILTKIVLALIPESVKKWFK